MSNLPITATHEEVNELKSQIEKLSTKLDLLATSISSMQTMLAESRGANIPARVSNLEQRMADVEKEQASRESAINLVSAHTIAIANLEKFQYKIIGVLIVVNAVLMVAGKFILDKIFPAVTQ